MYNEILHANGGESRRREEDLSIQYASRSRMVSSLACFASSEILRRPFLRAPSAFSQGLREQAEPVRADAAPHRGPEVLDVIWRCTSWSDEHSSAPVASIVRFK